MTDKHRHELWKWAILRTYGAIGLGHMSPSPGPRWWADEYPASATALYWRLADEQDAIEHPISGKESTK